MNRLVRTELLKLRCTRTTILLAVGGLGVAALLGVANAAIAGAPALGTAPWVTNVVGLSTIPAAIAVLLGVLLSAGEHQHQTITTTFLVTPQRSRVVASKAAAA